MFALSEGPGTLRNYTLNCRLKANPIHICCNGHRCLGLPCERARNMHWLCAQAGDLVCPQGSASVLVKALPVWNYSSFSPPFSRTSPWPALWPLKTSTSHPRRSVWAKCPLCTRSAFCLVKGAEGGGQSKNPRIMKYPTSAENSSLPLSGSSCHEETHSQPAPSPPWCHRPGKVLSATSSQPIILQLL